MQKKEVYVYCPSCKRRFFIIPIAGDKLAEVKQAVKAAEKKKPAKKKKKR